MKRVIFIAIVLLIAACSKPHPPVVVGKLYVLDDGTKLPKGICEYRYIIAPFTYSIRFQDSCNKYNVGDTIKPR